MPGFNLAGLWSGTDKNGEFKLSGKSAELSVIIPPGARIQILPNQNRTSDRAPEYNLVIFVDDQQQPAPPPAPRGYSEGDEAGGRPAPRPAPASPAAAAPRRPAAAQPEEEELEDPFAEDAQPANPPRFARPRR